MTTENLTLLLVALTVATIHASMSGPLSRALAWGFAQLAGKRRALTAAHAHSPRTLRAVGFATAVATVVGIFAASDAASSPTSCVRKHADAKTGTPSAHC